MTTNGERVALGIIVTLRDILGTPDNVDVTHHAAQVIAEAQRAREDLAQAQSWIAMLEADLSQVTLNMLYNWVVALPDFQDDPLLANDDLLAAIHQEWYEETQPL